MNPIDNSNSDEELWALRERAKELKCIYAVSSAPEPTAFCGYF